MRAACQLESEAHARLVTNNDNIPTILSLLQKKLMQAMQKQEMSLSKLFLFIFFSFLVTYLYFCDNAWIYLLSRLHYAPIKGAADTLKDNNPNNDKSLCGKLGALINQVNANERRGTLKQNKFELRTQAEDIRD